MRCQRRGEPRDGDPLVAGIGGHCTAGDDNGGVGRRQVVVGLVGDEAGLAQGAQHGVPGGVVHGRGLRVGADQHGDAEQVAGLRTLVDQLGTQLSTGRQDRGVDHRAQFLPGVGLDEFVGE